MSNLMPDIESFEERAAILEYDAGFSRADAEDRAAKAQGYSSFAHYKSTILEYLEELETTTE